MTQSPSKKEVRDAEARARACSERLDDLAQEFGDAHLLRAIAEYFEMELIEGALENWRERYNPHSLDVSTESSGTMDDSDDDDGDGD